MMRDLVAAAEPIDNSIIVELRTGMLEDAVYAQGEAVLDALEALRDPSVDELMA